jgi:hypothetical protein
MKHDQTGRSSVQTLLAEANPVPEKAVANSWRDPAGRAAYEAIVQTPLASEAPGRSGRSATRGLEGYSRPLTQRRGFLIGTAVVAASVAGGLVISGVPSRLLGTTGPAGKTSPPAGISHPVKITTWPSASAKTAKGTAPMLHYMLTGTVQPGSVTGLASARSVLLKLAQAAEHRSPLPQPAGADISFAVTNEWFMSTAIGRGAAASVIIPQVDQTWYAPNGLIRVLAHRGHPIVAVAGSPKNLRAAEYGAPVSNDRYHANYQDPAAASLSLDPAALRRELLKADPGGQPIAIRLIETISQLHHQVVSPRLDAAMWRVLAAQSDVRYLGRVKDRAGRAGQAVSFTERSGQQREVLIIGHDGQLLGWEQLILAGAQGLHLTAYPAVVGYVTFLGQHWTTTMNGSGK